MFIQIIICNIEKRYSVRAFRTPVPSLVWATWNKQENPLKHEKIRAKDDHREILPILALYAIDNLIKKSFIRFSVTLLTDPSSPIENILYTDIIPEQDLTHGSLRKVPHILEMS